ncbi:hypothetical protein OHS70_20870 [Streptomyces sp. NBC_00390]|uniref:hypothetical protein n=1 Tax=Streptomyces sp. NBC_00390 TaxID=2975736 RepID=UPI002E23937C
MKIRHVRAVAVFGIVLVALTGARGSGGGSCGGSSSSSSGGSSTGGSNHDNDNSTTTGGGSVSGGGSSANQAMRDISIAKCGLDAAGKNLTARLTIRNSDSLDYNYNASVQFKGEVGGPSADLAVARLDAAAVPAGESVTKEISTPYTGSGDGSEYKKCEVVLASRTAS